MLLIISIEKQIRCEQLERLWCNYSGFICPEHHSLLRGDPEWLLLRVPPFWETTLQSLHRIIFEAVSKSPCQFKWHWTHCLLPSHSAKQFGQHANASEEWKPPLGRGWMIGSVVPTVKLSRMLAGTASTWCHGAKQRILGKMTSY